MMLALLMIAPLGAKIGIKVYNKSFEKVIISWFKNAI
jgi:hypothetical protein